MDIEQSLVSKLLGVVDVQELLALSQDLVRWECGASQISWMASHAQKYGVVPSTEAFAHKFPGFLLAKEEALKEPLKYYVEEARKRGLFNSLRDALKEIAPLMKSRAVDEAVSAWRKASLALDPSASAKTREIDWAADPQKRHDEYFEQKESGPPGVQFLWETANSLTQGVSDGEIVYVVARSGIGKTWFEVIGAAHSWANGHNVLLISNEVSVRNILQRLDAKYFRLPYMDFRRHQLTPELEEDWKSGLGEFGDRENKLIVCGDGRRLGVSGIRELIERHKPDVWYIDGGYFLEDERKASARWERITNISSDLTANVAKATGIPGFVSWQFSKEASDKKGSARNIKYADIEMDAHMVIGLFQTEDQRENAEMTIKLLKNREGPKGEWLSKWDFDAMDFYEIQSLPDEESAGAASTREDLLF